MKRTILNTLGSIVILVVMAAIAAGLMIGSYEIKHPPVTIPASAPTAISPSPMIFDSPSPLPVPTPVVPLAPPVVAAPRPQPVHVAPPAPAPNIGSVTLAAANTPGTHNFDLSGASGKVIIDVSAYCAGQDNGRANGNQVDVSLQGGGSTVVTWGNDGSLTFNAPGTLTVTVGVTGVCSWGLWLRQ